MSRALPALLLLSLPLAGCGGADAHSVHEAAAQVDTRLVLVSGRDDHGLVAKRRVPVYDAAGSTRAVGTVADATLARVLGSDGSWLHLATVEGEPVDGWVDDFFLRGVVHLVGPEPSCRAEINGHRVVAGLQVVVRQERGGQVLVTGLTDPTVRGWTSRDSVQELGPQPPGCGDDPPESDSHG